MFLEDIPNHETANNRLPPRGHLPCLPNSQPGATPIQQPLRPTTILQIDPIQPQLVRLCPQRPPIQQRRLHLCLCHPHRPQGNPRRSGNLPSRFRLGRHRRRHRLRRHPSNGPRLRLPQWQTLPQRLVPVVPRRISTIRQSRHLRRRCHNGIRARDLTNLRRMLDRKQKHRPKSVGDGLRK